MSNAPVKVVQSLARHSTPSLTFGVYAHVGLFDQTGALDALPDLSKAAPRSEANTLAATGTDGGHISEVLALHLPYAGDGIGRDTADSGGMMSSSPEVSDSLATSHNPLETEGFDASCRVVADTDGNGGGGIRTHGRLAPTTVFKTVPIDHSGTPPSIVNPYCSSGLGQPIA
jgi:hypothetical protein